MTNIIDKTTKVNLGILGTLVVMAATGAFYFGGLKESVGSVDQSLRAVHIALDRNTAEIAKGHTLDAVMQARIGELERRIAEIERSKRRERDK